MPATPRPFAALNKDFPELVWVSASTLNIVGKRNNGMAVTLSNESFTRAVSSNITSWTLSGNLDAGSVAANTWYYLYAVTDGAAGFIVKASTASPSYVGGAGPSGFANNRYIGCIRTDASSNIVKFTKDRGAYVFSGGAFDVLSSSSPLNVFANTGTQQTWVVQLNGLTKYPTTSQLVRFGCGGARTNGDVMTQVFQEQISGTYYNRMTYGSTTISAQGGNFFPGGHYECDVINGVWQLSGASANNTAITAGVWVDGIKEPAHWFNN